MKTHYQPKYIESILHYSTRSNFYSAQIKNYYEHNRAISISFTLKSSASGSWYHDENRSGSYSGTGSTTCTILIDEENNITISNGSISYRLSQNNGGGSGSASISNVSVN